MGVHLGGGSTKGDRVLANGNLHSAKAEYGCTVYCDVVNSGTVRGGGEEAGGTGGYAMVGTCGT